MIFKRISIENWQQFAKIELDFHPRITIITGANGSGKTTILNILARHYGWEAQSLASPTKNPVSKVWSWFISSVLKSDSSQPITIGEITYSDESKSQLQIPFESGAQYQIQIANQQSVPCFFVPSHRSVFRYQPVSSLPTQNILNKSQAFQSVSNTNKQRYFGGNTDSSSFFMKQTLVAWSVFGHGNEDMEADETQLDNYKGFEAVLKVLIPPEIGFQKFIIKNYEVVLECDSGSFIIDAASGGLSAIIDLAWQIFMYSTDKTSEFTVLVDEIENHLHPTLQRRILPDLISAFPNATFIVSTHSPLIVASVKDSSIYALRQNNNKKTISEKLDFINEAKTASEILDEVLGVSFTMPIWVEERLNSIVEKYSHAEVSENLVSSMRSELAEIGLEKLIPEAAIRLVKNINEKD